MVRWSLLVMACLAVAAAAQEKPGGAAGAPKPDPQWPTREVSLEGKGLPFDRVLAALSASTGRRFTAVPHLRDRYATVLWKERPAAEAMLDLQTVWSLPHFPCEWRRQGSRKRDWQLWQDPRAADEFARLVAADLQRLREGIDKLIALAAREDVALPKRTGDEQIDRHLVSEREWQEVGRPLGRLLGTLPKARLDDLVRGKPAKAPWWHWSLGAQHDFETLFSRSSQSRFRDRMDAAEVGLTLELGRHSSWWSLGTQVDLEGNRSRNGIHVAPLGFSQGRVEPLVGDPAPLGTLTSERQAPLVQERAKWRELADVQMSVASVLGLALTSDYYSLKTPPVLGSLPFLGRPTEVPAGDLLRQMVDQATYQCTIQSERKTLLWRNRTAAFDDRGQVPATALERWRKVRDRQGYVGWVELAEMGRLTNTQIRTIEGDFPCAMEARANTKLLDWRAALSPLELAEAGRQRGLPVVRSNRAAVLRLLHGQLGGREPDPIFPYRSMWETLSIRVGVKREPGKIIHCFWVFSGAPPGGVELTVAQPIRRANVEKGRTEVSRRNPTRVRERD